ncbi:hypothetical protein R3398_18755 [Rossellomorea marisflavi]|uniref:hypothetical protein n=1 Tax=Rossellomorea marisflavi TaxID=189381 RepID=UPI00296FF6DA|nr:hypothetical protein [Rossellomorea marisflavi]MDW4528384.1 hypothetical protein [Rossellomorea marisflavi]
MKKRYLAVVLGAALFSSGFGGTTYSDFYSEASSAGNKIEMGTLKISAYEELPEPLFFSFPEGPYEGDGYWKPGKKSAEKYFAVQNDGSVNAVMKNVSITIHSISGAEDNEAARKSLEENLTFLITDRSGEKVFNGTLGELKGKPELLHQRTLSPKGSAQQYNREQYKIVATLSHDAGNEVQGARTDFDLTLYAGQE